MFNSLLDTAPEEQTPRSSTPWVWVGFLFAVAFFVLEFLALALGWEEPVTNGLLILVLLGGSIYWLFCIHRFHKVLAELTHNRYSISPLEAALKHIIPFYNLVWVFLWPAELSNYINGRGRVRIISGYVIGAMLLLALLLRFFDGAIGMAFLFGVTMYVSAKLKKHVEAGRRASPDQLPPLPDPKIFSQPVETAAGPAQGIAESPRVG
jgi:hypothetical protein